MGITNGNNVKNVSIKYNGNKLQEEGRLKAKNNNGEGKLMQLPPK